MAWFLGWTTLLLGLLWVGLVELTPISNGLLSGAFELYGLNQLELMVLLVFIAESPQRRFFFNIPGWVIGAVIVAISVLGYVGNRQWLYLLDFLGGLRAGGVWSPSRWVSSSELSGVPRLSLQAPAASRSGRGARRRPVRTVVPGPWQQPPPTPLRSPATRPSSTTCSTRSTPTAWTR